jgi:hypothetical protein
MLTGTSPGYLPAQSLISVRRPEVTSSGSNAASAQVRGSRAHATSRLHCAMAASLSGASITNLTHRAGPWCPRCNIGCKCLLGNIGCKCLLAVLVDAQAPRSGSSCARAPLTDLPVLGHPLEPGPPRRSGSSPRLIPPILLRQRRETYDTRAVRANKRALSPHMPDRRIGCYRVESTMLEREHLGWYSSTTSPDGRASVETMGVERAWHEFCMTCLCMTCLCTTHG